MSRRYSPKKEHLDEIIRELAADNDRAKAIVGGALLDNALEEAIAARLRPLTEAESNALFSDNGPFGTCSNKIAGGYAMGLYGPKTRRDMELINKVRNEFAHNMNPASFNDASVSNRCKEILTATDSDLHDEQDWRGKFVLAVQLLSGCLLVEARDCPRPPPGPPAELAD